MRQAKDEARSKEPMVGKVDLKVVQDIRRVLRRKYASRQNLERIFGQWNRSNADGITPQDLYMGLNRVGIKTTLNEAIVLHASAKN